MIPWAALTAGAVLFLAPFLLFTCLLHSGQPTYQDCKAACGDLGVSAFHPSLGGCCHCKESP